MKLVRLRRFTIQCLIVTLISSGVSAFAQEEVKRAYELLDEFEGMITGGNEAVASSVELHNKVQAEAIGPTHAHNAATDNVVGVLDDINDELNTLEEALPGVRANALEQERRFPNQPRPSRRERVIKRMNSAATAARRHLKKTQNALKVLSRFGSRLNIFLYPFSIWDDIQAADDLIFRKKMEARYGKWSMLKESPGSDFYLVVDTYGDDHEEVLVAMQSYDGPTGFYFGLTTETGERRKPGDADGDGSVDFEDFLILATSMGATNVGYDGGDFDLDGTVGDEDLVILVLGYDQ